MPTPRIIITSGEPAGIGPDIALKVLQRSWPCELRIAGDANMLAQRAALLGLPFSRDWVIHEPLAVPAQAGKLDAANARYVLRLIERAVAGCTSGQFQAMVTAPVQKSIIADSGIAFSGHTEYLAELTGAPLPVMMLVADDLRVALATIHIPLREVCAAISTTKLLAILKVIHSSLKDRYGLQRPRILVCGLNPHAGESGHLGREDVDVILPAIEQARLEQIEAIGPAPADTAFTTRSRADVDLVLAMYHDQGLPVIKYAGFGRAVNVTLGLPIVRTSVDHGAALSLAGTNEADEGSLIAAIEHALGLTTHAPSRLS